MNAQRVDSLTSQLNCGRKNHKEMEEVHVQTLLLDINYTCATAVALLTFLSVHVNGDLSVHKAGTRDPQKHPSCIINIVVELLQA
jgi:hypothetical protein